MPTTPVPTQSLTDTITRMQRQLDELGRAVGRPSVSMRDTSDNVVQLVPGSPFPVLGARGQDASVVMGNGAVAIADETGRNPRPITAATFYGPVQGDSTGVHHGDVGTTTETHNHYGDLHGNAYGFHYGPVGDGSTQYQVNALGVFATSLNGPLFGTVGVPGQAWHCYITCHGNVGVPGDNWTLYGTVVAPSERRLKTEIRSIPDPGGIVDAVPAYRWRWDPDKVEDPDDGEHAGPMVDDLDRHAPWLVTRSPGAPRAYADRDLIGVLWEALRHERHRTRDLEARVAALESGR